VPIFVKEIEQEFLAGEVINQKGDKYE